MVQKDQKVGDLVKLGFGKKKKNDIKESVVDNNTSEATPNETPASDKKADGRTSVISIKNLQ